MTIATTIMTMILTITLTSTMNKTVNIMVMTLNSIITHGFDYYDDYDYS